MQTSRSSINGIFAYCVAAHSPLMEMLSQAIGSDMIVMPLGLRNFISTRNVGIICQI